MARMHVLQSAGQNQYTVIVHTPTPAGNNAAGVAWSAALVGAGLNKSSLAVGTGAGQISAAENTQITNGEVIETQFTWGDDPSWTNPQRLADLDTRATQMVNETLATYADRLKYFGATVA